MANFPLTPILDSFNRANEGPPPSSNWTGLYGGGLKVSSNTLVPNATSETSGAYWNASTFGPDCEVFVTIVSQNNDSAGRLYARIEAAGINGYTLQWNSFSDLIRVNEVDNLGNENQLGADISQTLSNGDSLGLSVIGSTLTVWYKASGGSWVSLGTRTDSSHSSAGYIGLDLYTDGTASLDDFGGGTVKVFSADALTINSILPSHAQAVSVNPNALTISTTTPTPGAIVVVFIPEALLLTSTLPPPSLSGASDATVNVQCLVIQSIVTTPDALTVAINAAAQTINSNITDQTETVSIDAAAQQISTLIGDVVETVSIDAPGQEIDSFLPQPSLSGAVDATVSAPCLVMTSNICQPDLLLSVDAAAQIIASNLGLSAPTVSIDAPGQTLASGIQQPGVTVAPDISALQAIFSLPGVTITLPGSSVVFNASALTMSAILGSVSISQIYREIAQARKHGQPRYVNKINALRRIAKRSDSTLTSKHEL